jgi:UDP-N-acetylglucosamine 2-epimerase (non-hydrolysing)
VRGLSPSLVFTGQHPHLDSGEYGLGHYRSLRLDCRGREDPNVHVGLVSKALLPILLQSPPDLLIVQGDTSSALGGALSAGMADVPLAHVEAGLRSHDRRRPWPEEEFRIAIDEQAELLFAVTELSAANLRREKVRGQIHVTGNTGADALVGTRNRAKIPIRRRDRPSILVTCHRRENWREGLDGIADALRRIAFERIAAIEVILHPNPAVARRLRAMLAGARGIAFRQPCGHLEMIEAMVGSDLVLSDSGGMQEEAAMLGVPLLVLRDRTERPEAIASGNIEMVGTDPEKITSAVLRMLSGGSAAAPSPCFGDGHSSSRIATVIEEWLHERDELNPQMTTLRRTA